MTSVQLQKEISSRLNIKEKKLSRLFRSKNLSQRDFERVNYIYEEKQNLNFFFSIGASAFTSIFFNAIFLKQLKLSRQLTTIMFQSAIWFFFWKRKVEVRYLKQIEPYFEKYQIK